MLFPSARWSRWKRGTPQRLPRVCGSAAGGRWLIPVTYTASILVLGLRVCGDHRSPVLAADKTSCLRLSDEDDDSRPAMILRQVLQATDDRF